MPIIVFLLLSHCEVSKFLTRYYCRVIFGESFDVRTNPIVGNLVHLGSERRVRRAGQGGACASPDRRPRLEQVPSVLISMISGEEIANTKTRALTAHRA